MGISRLVYWSGLPCSPPGDLPNQGLNPGLLHCNWILYHLSHQGSPRILNWVAYPFSGGSSQPMNQARIPCSASGFFTSWATREAQKEYYLMTVRYSALCLLSLCNMSMTKTASMYLFITTTQRPTGGEHKYTHTHTHTPTHTHAAFLQKFFYLGVTTSWVGLLMPPSQNQTHKLCNQVRFRPNCLENPTK